MYRMLTEWVSQVLDKVKDEKGISSIVDVSSKMSSSIDEWDQMYSVDNKEKSLNLASAIAGEYARLITLEMESSVKDGLINKAYQRVIKDLRINTEYGCALGSLILKPYISNGEIKVSFVQSDSFYPLAFDDSGNITSIVFMEQIRRKNEIFSKFEVHELEKNILRVINFAYRSKDEGFRGTEISLTEVPEWADIQEETILTVDGPLYGYFRVPVANTIDKKSPMGVSVYSKAISLIKQADKMYERILWEYEGSELGLDINEAYFTKDQNGKSVLPEGKERLFRRYAINAGINEKPFYEVFSPAIRDSSLFNGLNKLLQRIEFNCSLAYGTLSDPQMVEKTAEEIRTSKQRSYTAVSDCQKAMQTALEDLIRAMSSLARIYKLGQLGDIEPKFKWDDSIIVDTKTEGSIRMQEVSAGLLRPELYLAWRYGVSEKEALKMMPGSEDTQTDTSGDNSDA